VNPQIRGSNSWLPKPKSSPTAVTPENRPAPAAAKARPPSHKTPSNTASHRAAGQLAHPANCPIRKLVLCKIMAESTCSTIVESPLQIGPFYAKQSQFKPKPMSRWANFSELNELGPEPLSVLGRQVWSGMPSTQPVRLNYQDRFDSMLEKRLSPDVSG
jgi:hypothetical protein